MFRTAALMSLSLATFAVAQVIPEVPTIPQSVGVQLKEPNLNDWNLDLIKDAGFKVVRRGFLWQGVEKEAGVYTFDKYDKLVKDCKDRNLQLVVTLALGNDKLYGHVKDEKGREGYVKYATAVVERYKGQGLIYELWNEPNTKTFWGKHGKVGNSEEYAREYMNLVAATVPAIRKADPKAVILGGSVSNLWTESYKWQGYIFGMGILKSGIDIWSVHPYGLKMPEDTIEAYGIVRDLMKKSGSEPMTMVNSERGFSVTQKGEGQIDGDKKAEYQAWSIVRQQIIDMYCDIKFTVWYEWSGGEGFSLLTHERTDTPALKAARVMLKQLDGCQIDKRITLENDRDFAFQMKGKDGRLVLVAWTVPPKGQPPEKTVDHEAEIPVDAKGTLETANLYGEAGKVDVEGGKVKLQLTGAPQYVKLK